MHVQGIAMPSRRLIDILPRLNAGDSLGRPKGFLLHRRLPQEITPVRSYTSSTGVSPLREPRGEDTTQLLRSLGYREPGEASTRGRRTSVRLSLSCSAGVQFLPCLKP